MIAVLYKEWWKKASGSGESDITREKFSKLTNGICTFMGESKTKISHSKPFSVELPKKCIKLFSFLYHRVLDPFLGSSSTLRDFALTKRRENMD